jgi:hypothetical protein
MISREDTKGRKEMILIQFDQFRLRSLRTLRDNEL